MVAEANPAESSESTKMQLRIWGRRQEVAVSAAALLILQIMVANLYLSSSIHMCASFKSV